jgi:hypothetical protein
VDGELSEDRSLQLKVPKCRLLIFAALDLVLLFLVSIVSEDVFWDRGCESCNQRVKLLVSIYLA